MNKTRPEHLYRIKGERGYVRRSSPPLVVAFRVHYRLDCEDPDLHHVTPYLWEHEVPDWLAMVRGTPGASLCEAPGRPDGVEAIRGYAPETVREPERDPMEFWLARVAALRDRLRTPDGLVQFGLPLVQRVPEEFRSAIAKAVHQAASE